MIVISVWLSFKQQSNYAAKISSLTSTKNMTVGTKNNYAQAIKLDLTFFSFGFYIFWGFLSSSLQQKKTRSTNRNNPKWTRWRPLMPESSRHAQQQDKMNAKGIIHGICSIFRLFVYQINTKFVLTVSRRIHSLSSIRQHPNHAPQEKKTNKCEET